MDSPITLFPSVIQFPLNQAHLGLVSLRGNPSGGGMQGRGVVGEPMMQQEEKQEEEDTAPEEQRLVDQRRLSCIEYILRLKCAP